jgi:hypothetical protein
VIPLKRCSVSPITFSTLAAAGILAGLLASGFIAHSAEARLTGFDVSPLGPYALGDGLLLVTTQVARFIPAHRAAKIDIAQTPAGE